MRTFQQDKLYRDGRTLKTTFRDDVARVQMRRDNRVAVSYLGTTKSYTMRDSLPATLAMVDVVLDNWDN